jgi:predicted O-linked N-acetylglucosamine transferase (SPINDLY family)
MEYKQFNDLFLSLFNNIQERFEKKRIIYSCAESITNGSNDSFFIADIYYKLYLLYPDDVDNLLHIANNFKNNPFFAIFYHIHIHSIKPLYMKNIIALIQLCIDNGIPIYSLPLTFHDSLFNDKKFLAKYAQSLFQQFRYRTGLNYTLKAIKMFSSQVCVSKEDKYDKWSNYHDVGYVYYALGDVDNALKYTNKAAELALKFDLSMEDKMLSYSNSLCYEDFDYPDNNTLIHKYEKIHIYYPDKPMFSFNTNNNSKIRIGYVSGNFVYHVIGNFIIPIIQNHDLSQFEIYLFANQYDSVDLYKNLNCKFIHIKHLNDMDAAKLIHSHNINILIDLDGHTVNNRLGIFAYHPAPVQMTYLGYPNTTGMKSIQYRITDDVADHVETTQKYSEKLIRLPTCFLLYKSIYQIVPMKPRKTDNTIILAAINKEIKNSKHTLATWATILKECPHVKILIKLEEVYCDNDEYIKYYTTKLNVPSSRIILMNKLMPKEYINLFGKFDILLDTFPYSGTTTSCNALFNSLPIVTLYNKNHHSHNVSASLLSCMGLTELIAYTNEQYIDIVKYLVNNPNKIDEYKQTIGKKFNDTVMNPNRFMKHYQNALITAVKYTQ